GATRGAAGTPSCLGALIAVRSAELPKVGSPEDFDRVLRGILAVPGSVTRRRTSRSGHRYGIRWTDPFIWTRNPCFRFALVECSTILGNHRNSRDACSKRGRSGSPPGMTKG